LSDFQSAQRPGPSQTSNALISILIGAVLAQMMTCVFLLYQQSRMRNMEEQTRIDVAQATEKLRAEIADVRQISTAMAQQTSQVTAETLDSLKTQLEATQRDAKGTDGKKRAEAERKAASLEREIATVKEQLKSQDQKLTVASEEATKANSEVAVTKGEVGKLSTDVDTVKTGLTSTNSEIEKQKAELKSVKGDLNQQSSLIATSANEVAKLKALGERDIFEFKISKDSTFQRVGPVQMSLMVKLRAVEPNKNRYSIDVLINDKSTEKKNRTVNEPLQFRTARDQFLELVVYELQKNTVVGYLSAPKVQQAH
jgi:hypothetical protein